MKSCIYQGKVRHRRNSPTYHQFDFRTFMLMLDLDELPTVFSKRWLWSTRGRAVARFRDSDRLRSHSHLATLRQRVEAILAENGISDELSSIGLLTQLRYLGFEMNPVCFYYCFSNCSNEHQGSSTDYDWAEDTDQHPKRLVAIVAEVNNTPWGEQHNYIIRPDGISGEQAMKRSSIKSLPINKSFHVSPFMGMNMDYRMSFSKPGKKLAVKIENHLHDEPENKSVAHLNDESNEANAKKVLDVTMLLERTSLTGANLNWMLVKYPLISFQTFGAIYWQALRLYLKKVPFFSHPKNSPSSETSGSNPDGDGSTATSNSVWLGQ